MKMYYDVRSFRTYFMVPCNDTPCILDPKIQAARVEFLEEEIRELKEAYENKDLVKVTDALLDLVYVALGTLDLMGLDPMILAAAWEAIHEANMRKIRIFVPEEDEDIKFNIKKPEGWIGPEEKIRLLLDE